MNLQGGPVAVQKEMNVLALVKESERYVFLYDEESPASLLQTLGRYAADKELSFTWYDAALLSQKVRRLQRKSDQTKTENQRDRFRESTW